MNIEARFSSFAQNRTPDRVNKIQIAVQILVANDAMCLLIEANILEVALGEIAPDVLSMTVALVSAKQGAAFAFLDGNRVDLD